MSYMHLKHKYHLFGNKSHCTFMFSFEQGVSEADITTIIDKHNELRKNPHKSTTAAKMLLMVSYLNHYSDI